MMFNKVYNLVYGKFLNHFKNVEILAFKEPSSIKKVDYKKIVEGKNNNLQLFPYRAPHPAK